MILCVYDLYDLSEIITMMRHYYKYERFNEVLEEIIKVLQDRSRNGEINIIRTALSNIQDLDRELFHFVYTQNVYTYFPGFLKDEKIYAVLIRAFLELQIVLKSKNDEQIFDLADTLHNLPNDISKNLTIPKWFWSNLKYYREKWDKDFLRNEQKLMKNKFI